MILNKPQWKLQGSSHKGHYQRRYPSVIERQREVIEQELQVEEETETDNIDEGYIQEYTKSVIKGRY